MARPEIPERIEGRLDVDVRPSRRTVAGRSQVRDLANAHGATPSGYRISDQGILNVAFGLRSRRDHNQIYRRARAAGARRNGRPVYLPGAGVVYVNDPDRFSVELLRMSSALERRWGFRARPTDKRPRADTHSVEQTVRIAAPGPIVWDAITDHSAMSEWLRPVAVHRTVDGTPVRDGRGSERLLRFAGMSITERVTGYERPTAYRYQVTHGSPFICHQGEVRLRTQGDQTELTWRIRFRPRLLGTGRPLAIALSWLLNRVLRSGVVPYIELLAAQAENAGGAVLPPLATTSRRTQSHLQPPRTLPRRTGPDWCAHLISETRRQRSSEGARC